MPFLVVSVGVSRALKSPATVAALFIFLAVASVAAGQIALAQRAGSQSGLEAVAPALIATARIKIQDEFELTRAFVGQLEPAQRTDLAFELGGTINAILVEEGERVEAGQLIATLDTDLLQAERRRAEAARQALAAQVELAALTDERQRALQQRGFVSAQASDAATLGLAELTARISEIDAGLEEINIRIGKARITAPFAARVSMRYLDRGSNARPGQPVVALAESVEAQFRVGLVPAAVNALQADEPVEIRIDGTPYSGRLFAILPELDPATRTMTVVFRISDDRLPAYRTTGTVLLPETVTARGAWVPISALVAGPRAVWQLKVPEPFGDDYIVATESVEILFAAADRAFVRGSFPDDARYMVDGTHRVVPGQRVRISAAPE